jgi:hypothetical protein
MFLPACDTLPEELQNSCAWSPDCSGIQCCTEFHFSEGKRNVMLEFNRDCANGKFQYGLENKKWNRPVSELNSRCLL